MSSSTDVLGAFRNHLVALELMRKASVAGPLPPAIIEPRGGAPAPGEGEGTANDPDLIVTLRGGGEIPPGDNGWLLQTTIDVRYRGLTAERIMRLDADIVASLHEGPGIRRRAWEMGGLFVLETGIWVGLTPLEHHAAQGFDYVTRIYVEAYR